MLSLISELSHRMRNGGLVTVTTDQRDITSNGEWQIVNVTIDQRESSQRMGNCGILTVTTGQRERESARRMGNDGLKCILGVQEGGVFAHV